MARKVYRVLPDGDDWVVKHEGSVLSRHATKEPAISSAKTVAKANKPSQVVVHRKDGTIEEEWTYDDDPYPPPG